MKSFLSILALAASLPRLVSGDFGDYVDPTFNCPATTTCMQVCVSNVGDCPTEMLCENGNETLCPDGTCSESCEDHEESPCAFECAPVACSKVIDFHDSCQEKYGTLWDAEAACGEKEYEENTSLYSFIEPGFIFFYVWFSAAPILLLLWCAFNQRASPVPGSCQKLDLEPEEHTKENNPRIAWQTGFKYHPVGLLMHTITMSTVLLIYTLLIWLIIQYYIQQEAIEWSWVAMRFEDEVQVLLCFILVWMYGFFYTFSLKFPFSIRSLNLRRCTLDEAHYVAIAVKRLEVKGTEVIFVHDYLRGVKQFFSSFYTAVHGVLTFLFSDKNTFGCERNSDDASFTIKPVQTDVDGTRYITFEFRRYNLVALQSTDDGEPEHLEPKFIPGGITVATTVGDVIALNQPNGLSIREVEDRRSIIGSNKVEMEKPSFLRCLKREFSTPFYSYQIFIVFSWIPLWYYYMAFTWGLVMIIGALTVSILQYKNENNLYRLTHVEADVEVVRDGQKMSLSQDQLVPGDVVSVVPGQSYCDMVLVSATRVLVDESALTGEANPVGKTALDPRMAKQVYDVSANKRSTIFAGTSVLEAESSTAIVMKTASYTARGELIRDIFSYRRNVFKFDTEVPIVLVILFFYACIGWGLAFYWTGEIFVFGWFYGMYVVAGCLPPLLPTVFTVSVGISDGRLAGKKVACTNSESILVAGKVTRAYFDKTGTITKQGLDFVSARGKSSWIDESKGFSQEMSLSLSTDELKLGMACCHSLTRSHDGKMIGNPVDRVMFENSRAKLEDSGDQLVITDDTGRKVSVVRNFDFDHHRMTQSVIIQEIESGRYLAFCKGSGEAIRDICLAETLPSNFDRALRASAKSGLYQISMCMKMLPDNVDPANISRDDIESGLSFQGVVNFKNLMRENAKDVILQLSEGAIVSTMVTGDNVLTGVCIARESGIITENKRLLIGELENDYVVWKTTNEINTDLPELDAMHGVQLAATGAAWRHICTSDPKLSAALHDHVRVFGRCTPHDKVAIVQDASKFGHITLMSGDGGNDCGALKAAHVGVALSDADASIVAPFTSLSKDIDSVIDVVREGRCALGSAIASYKFIIMYGQILCINQLIAAYFNITFAEWGWVFMDGVWTITLSFALPLAKAATKLSPSRPTASVLGLHTMSSALGVLVINFLFVVISFMALNNQPWYACRKWSGTDVSNLFVIGDNYETQVLWLVTGYQVISSATVFNFGYEFRQAWIRNNLLVLLIVGYSAIHFYITLNPSDISCFFRINCLNEYTFDGIYGALSIQNDFNTTIIPEEFRRILIGIMVGNTASNVLWDYVVVNGCRRYFGAKRRATEVAEREAQVDNVKPNQELGAPDHNVSEPIHEVNDQLETSSEEEVA